MSLPTPKHLLAGSTKQGKRRGTEPNLKTRPEEEPRQTDATENSQKCGEAKMKIPEIYLEGEMLALDPEVPEIHKVILRGDLESLKELVASGADVNAEDPDGWPPLHTAIKSGQIGCASFLIKHGASDFFERQQEEYMRRLNVSSRTRGRFFSM